MTTFVQQSGLASCQPLALPAEAPAGIAVSGSTGLADVRRMSDWLSRVVARIQSLQRLPQGWNSYNANRIDRTSVQHAVRIVSELARIPDVREPIVGATPDGNVAVSWDSPSSSLDLEVLPDGKVAFAFLDKACPANDKDGTTTSLWKIAMMLTNTGR